MVGVQHCGITSFFELKQEASRTLNLRQVIANNVNIRRSAEALKSCDKTGDLCGILQGCLEPIWFSGFQCASGRGFALKSGMLPLQTVGQFELSFLLGPEFNRGNKLERHLHHDASKWKDARAFTLHRKNTLAPLWMDLNVFTTTGFSAALTNVFEQLQDDWLTADRLRVIPQRSAAGGHG